MAETAKFRAQITETGRECGLDGLELANYVSEAFDKRERLQAELALKKNSFRLKEKQLQAELAEREKQIQAELEEKEKRFQAELEEKEKRLQAEMEDKERERQHQLELRRMEIEVEIRRIEKGSGPTPSTSSGSPVTEPPSHVSQLNSGAMSFPLDPFNEQTDHHRRIFITLRGNGCQLWA